MDSKNERKVALITGASRGIGAQIAETFTQEGYDLILVDLPGNEQLEPLIQKIKKEDQKIEPVFADLSKQEDCEAVVKKAKDVFGRIDVLVNNAGITRDGLAMRMSREQFTTVIDINLTAVFVLSSLVLPVMIRQKSGCIINMSSVSGVYGNAGQANYSASKAGVIGLTKSLAKEVGSRNITVNAIAPGFIETDMTKKLPEKVIEGAKERIALGRIGQPSDVANVAAFLASDKASYVTGQVIEVAGGLTI